MTPRPSQWLRSLTTVIAILSLTVGAMVATALPASAIAYKMTNVFAANAAGDVLVQGNSVLTCATGVTNCAAAQDGGNYTNDVFNMGYIDVDGDASTFNSSTANVSLPEGATVLFAALVWGAMTSASSSTGLPGVAAPDASVKNRVSFKPPGGSYATVTADRLDGTNPYQGYSVVTSAVAAGGSGTYTVGNLQAGTGGDRYGGWSLAVAYRDVTQPMRRLAVYRGFANIAGSALMSFPVNGFTTPPTGSVVTQIGAVAFDTDRGQTGEYLNVGTTALSNSLNPANDVFNSTVTDLGVAVTSRSPSYANTLGFDVDRYDATGVLANGATSATINLGATNDGYYPAIITFATDVKAPNLTAVKTMTDVNGGSLAPGDLIDYSVGITNTGVDTSASSEISDIVPAGTTYISGSLQIDGAAVTDDSGDDAGNVTNGTVKARIGTGADAALGGRLEVNDTATMDFRVEVDAGAGDASVISNTATLTYTSATTGASFSSQSNTVNGTVVDSPLLPSTVNLTRSAASTRFGVPVTLDASVGLPGMTGTVTFTDVPTSGPQSGNTVTLGTSAVLDGAATLTLPLPAFGLNTVKAAYSGDDTYEAATSTTVEVEVSAYAGEVIVSEFRWSGPNGTSDNYVELLNTGPAVPLAGFQVTADSGMVSNLQPDAGVRGTGRSYLISGSGLSFNRQVANTDVFVPTVGMGGMTVTAPDTAVTVTDAAGPATGAHSGTGLPAITGNPGSSWAWVRTEVAGVAVDTRDNAADFRLVSDDGGVVGGVQSMLGSASPTGTADPYQHNADLRSALFDPAVAANRDPNRVAVPGTPGTLTIRRMITNASNGVVTAAKVRVTALSEADGDAKAPWALTTPARRANLRVVDPATATSQFTVGGSPVTVRNLSVDAPVTASPGGGLNTTLTVPLPRGGLAPGASVAVAFTFRYDTRGTFWFSYDVDALGGQVIANRVGRVSQPKHRLTASTTKRLATKDRNGSLVKVVVASGKLR